MWFKRKNQNRRLHRDHVLDVKLRADQVRAGRFRMVAVGLGICFTLVAATLVFWRGGEWLLNRFIYENDAFAIRSIDVRTDGVIAPEQIRKWAMVRPDANLLALDLLRVKRDLELVPFIKSSTVERVLPHTLRIRISEREPIAEITVPQRTPDGGFESVNYYLDEEGFLMPGLGASLRASPLPANEQFPQLTGISSAEIRPGKQVQSPSVHAALRLIVEFDQSPMAGVEELQKIDVSAADILQAVTAQGGEVVFSFNDIHRQLSKWRQAHDWFQTNPQPQAIAMIDLSISNNIPTRPVLASSVPAIAPKVAKPSRIRKKNV